MAGCVSGGGSVNVVDVLSLGMLYWGGVFCCMVHLKVFLVRDTGGN